MSEVVTTPPQDSTGAPHSRIGRFQSGQLLAERYRIVADLGSGGMGEVYRADDLTLGQSIALKFLPHDLIADPVRLEKLRDEVRLTRQISHPNVCRIYDIVEAEGQSFFSMEYIDGEDLGLLLRRIGRISGDKGIELARQICAGLAAAHEQGVIHRDLKPANIMIDGRGKARITDFGVAGVVSDLSEGKQHVVGTPAYMAPEQLEGGPVTRQSDIYSLGLVLFELFTGKRAHSANTIAELKDIHTSSRTTTNPSDLVADLDPTVERVILWCLETKPEDRPPNALAVMAALPGGDPLRAMIEAGETPSPELVAAAGRSGAGNAVVALAMAVFTALVLIGVIVIHTINSADRAHKGMLSPSILENRALEILDALGYDREPKDTAWDYELVTSRMNEGYELASNDRWEFFAQERPTTLYFWLRTSPEPMVPIRSTLPSNDWLGGRVSRTDPPETTPGMTQVVLSRTGRLLGLRVVSDGSRPPLAGPEANDGATVDLASILELAGYEIGELREVNADFAPSVAWDRRRAFVGADSDATAVQVRIDVAEFKGALTFFEVNEGGADSVFLLTEPPFKEEQRKSYNLHLMIGLIGGGILAFRNYRMRRIDRKGLFRLGVAMFLLTFGAAALYTDHSGTLAYGPTQIFAALAYGLVRAFVACVLYVGLEPYIRKLYPRALVAWSRLISGRWKDPALGREMLIGLSTASLWWGIAYAVGLLIGYGSMGAATGVPIENTFGVALLLAQVAVGIGNALTVLFVFVIARSIIPAPSWVQSLFGAIVVFGFYFLQGAGPMEGAAAYFFPALTTLAVVFLISRSGLIALFMFWVVNMIMQTTTLTYDLDQWFVGTTIAFVALFGSLIFFAFRIATAGQQLFPSSLDPA